MRLISALVAAALSISVAYAQPSPSGDLPPHQIRVQVRYEQALPSSKGRAKETVLQSPQIVTIDNIAGVMKINRNGISWETSVLPHVNADASISLTLDARAHSADETSELKVTRRGLSGKEIRFGSFDFNGEQISIEVTATDLIASHKETP